MGLFEIPTFKRSPDGILALVLGILLGGLGIIITGAVASHKNTVIVGVLQLLTGFIFGLGWLWAIVWGILIFVRSQENATTVPPTPPAA